MVFFLFYTIIYSCIYSKFSVPSRSSFGLKTLITSVPKIKQHERYFMILLEQIR